jgi:Protein of unknown function (DUF4242)
MPLYAIIRRNGFVSLKELERAAVRATTVADAPGSGVRWIRSYVLAEESAEVGTLCIYEADSPEAIRVHAAAAVLPVDEIVPISETLIVRPDPVPARA